MILLVNLILQSLSFPVLLSPSNEIVGQWVNKENNMRIDVFLEEDGYYYGKSVSKTDSEKSQIVLSRLVYDKTGKNYKGFMKPPDSNIELNAIIEMINENSIKLIVSKLMVKKYIYLHRAT